MQVFPIDSLIPELLASLRNQSNLVIEAAPGAGKTTRIPPALLSSDISGAGEIWVLEPRRVAARLSAHRVASEMGETIGETVGYQIRYDEVSSNKTRLRFLTEGIFLRKLLNNPTLNRVSVVILDEFHERNLHTDVAIALLRRLQKTARPDLKIVVMSATLDVEKIAGFLGDCRILKSDQKQFDVEVEYLSSEERQPLSALISRQLERLFREGNCGDVLVFLPGATEIRKTQDACSNLAKRFETLIFPLHGDLPNSVQEQALCPNTKRKIILATNIAETSLTIDGVTTVIDSGLARTSDHSAWTGLSSRSIQRISKSSAIQRAGRAGRTRAGRCLRLYTEMDFSLRPQYEIPEIFRVDLATTILEFSALGIVDHTGFNWFEPPRPEAIDSASRLLYRLGVLDTDSRLTEIGNRVLSIPAHPRLGRILIEAQNRGIGEAGALLAALLGERNIRYLNFDENLPGKKISEVNQQSDIFILLDQYLLAQDCNFDVERLMNAGINPGAVRAVDKAAKHFLKIVTGEKIIGKFQKQNIWKDEEKILLTLLSGFPDRVASLQESDNAKSVNRPRIYQLCEGKSAQLGIESLVHGVRYIIAIEAEEKNPTGRTSMPIIRSASKIEPEWLLDFWPDAIREKIALRWDEKNERILCYSQLLYEEIVLSENRIIFETIVQNSDLLDQAETMLYEQVLGKGIESVMDLASIERLKARIAFVSGYHPSFVSYLSILEKPEEIIKRNCRGQSSLNGLRHAVDHDSMFNILLSSDERHQLNILAPEAISIPRRQRIRVNYETGKSPWIESRIQDFFGLTESPRIAKNRESLVIHLLGPNHRPIQITQDLAGFWEKMYPKVRRELMRRYPKHFWPEDPIGNLTGTIKDR